jgi:hypothetical protein
MTAGVSGAVTSRRILLTLAGIAVIMAAAGAALFYRYATRSAPDPRRLAVAPFDVMVEQPGLATARVGLAEGLTHAFQHSGTHTAVPQTEVARVWRASVTPFIAAIELARRSGAGLAVYGRVDPGPGDSLWIRAAVLDSHSARGLFEVETLAPPTGLDRAADTIAAMMLRRLRTS